MLGLKHLSIISLIITATVSHAQDANKPGQVDYAISIAAEPGLIMLCGIDDDFHFNRNTKEREKISLTISKGFSKKSSQELLDSGKLVLYSMRPRQDAEGNVRVQYGHRVLYREVEVVDGTEYKIKHDGDVKSLLKIKKRDMEAGTLLDRQPPVVRHIDKGNATVVSFPIAKINGKTKAICIYLTKNLKSLTSVADFYTDKETLTYTELLKNIVPVQTAPKLSEGK